MQKKELVNRVIEYIINCKPPDFSSLKVKKLAEHFKVSASYLSREFKKQTKVSLFEFILRVKTKHACLLLQQSQKRTVKEVSQILDFSSSDYFTKVFKSYVGITPGEFQKINKGINGLGDPRQGTVDRRTGKRDRRSGTGHGKPKLLLSVNIGLTYPVYRDRRGGVADRRKGSGDRRRIINKKNRK